MHQKAKKKDGLLLQRSMHRDNRRYSVSTGELCTMVNFFTYFKKVPKMYVFAIVQYFSGTYEIPIRLISASPHLKEIPSFLRIYPNYYILYFPKLIPKLAKFLPFFPKLPPHPIFKKYLVFSSK